MPGKRGVTLIELLIAIVLSAIVIIGAVNFFRGIQKNYTLADQVNDCNQNVQYAMKKLVEVFEQAGSGLDSSITAITVNGANHNDISMVINPYGGYFTLTDDMPATGTHIPAANASGFKKTYYCYRHLYNSVNTEILHLDTNTGNPAGFSHGIGTNNDSILLIAADSRKMLAGDVICSIDYFRYFLQGTNICIKQDAQDSVVLAENIDTLRITFLKSDMATAATTWQDMCFTTIFICGRTALPDPKYPGDGYRRTSQHMTVSIKSKIK